MKRKGQRLNSEMHNLSDGLYQRHVYPQIKKRNYTRKAALMKDSPLMAKDERFVKCAYNIKQRFLKTEHKRPYNRNAALELLNGVGGWRWDVMRDGGSGGGGGR